MNNQRTIIDVTQPSAAADTYAALVQWYRSQTEFYFKFDSAIRMCRVDGTSETVLDAHTIALPLYYAADYKRTFKSRPGSRPTTNIFGLSLDVLKLLDASDFAPMAEVDK